MNGRIRELCIQSGAYEHYEVNEGVDGDDVPMQRFAERIVRECAKVFWNIDDGELHEEYVRELKKHFGVE